MRVIRLSLYLVIGLLLGGLSALSYAGTYHATYKYPTSWGQHDSPESAFADQMAHNMFGCNTSYTCAFVSAAHVVTGVNVTYSRKNIQNGTAYSDGVAALSRQPICANGGTLSGTYPNEICTKTCTAPQELQPDGTCAEAPKCKGNQTPVVSPATCGCNLNLLNFNSGPRPWLSGSGGSIPATVCDGGCLRNTGFGLGGGTSWTAEGGAFSGATCTEGEALPTKEPVPNKAPPCGASEGVMTSSSGTVACVPEGTPTARKPEVEKKQKTETFPDGTQKTTETTQTTDPATGASGTTTKTTSTGGQSGSAGTTTTSESSSGKDANGDGMGDSGSGSGSGDGDGNCEGSDCGDGEGWPSTDELYKKKDKTFQSV